MIVTFKMDDNSQEIFNHLRQRYFPKERNYLNAHITLFHNIADEALNAHIWQELEAEMPFEIEFANPFFMGFGTAIEIRSSKLIQLTEMLQRHFCDLLSTQDRRTKKPHITLQNKMPAFIAKQDYESICKEWTPIKGFIIGYEFYEYQSGSWKQLKTY